MAVSASARARPAAALLVLLAAACTSTPAVHGQDRSGASGIRACQEGWSSPITIRTQDGRPVFVDQPDVVRSAQGLTLISEPTLVWPSAELRPEESFMWGLLDPDKLSAGAVLDSTQSAVAFVPEPSGVTHMREVRVLPDTGGLAHVFWGSVHPDSSQDSPVARWWYARFDGKEWSAPELVLEVDRIWSGRTTVTVLEAHGSLHVAATVSDRSHSPAYRSGAQYARRTGDGGWSSQWIELGPHDGQVRYVALAALPTAGHLVLAFTGHIAPAPVRVGRHGLYVMHSYDAGISWTPPELVRPLDTDSGWLLDVAEGPRGEIVLLWVTIKPPSPGSMQVVRHASVLISPDGRSWRKLPDLPIPTGLTGRVPIVATSDGFAVLADDAMTRRLHLWRWTLDSTASVSDNGWIGPASLELPEPALLPTLSSLRPGQLLATWTVHQQLDVPGHASTFVPSTRLAAFHICPSR